MIPQRYDTTIIILTLSMGVGLTWNHILTQSSERGLYLRQKSVYGLFLEIWAVFGLYLAPKGSISKK